VLQPQPKTPEKKKGFFKNFDKIKKFFNQKQEQFVVKKKRSIEEKAEEDRRKAAEDRRMLQLIQEDVREFRRSPAVQKHLRQKRAKIVAQGFFEHVRRQNEEQQSQFVQESMEDYRDRVEERLAHQAEEYERETARLLFEDLQMEREAIRRRAVEMAVQEARRKQDEEAYERQRADQIRAQEKFLEERKLRQEENRRIEKVRKERRIRAEKIKEEARIQEEIIAERKEKAGLIAREVERHQNTVALQEQRRIRQEQERRIKEEIKAKIRIPLQPTNRMDLPGTIFDFTSNFLGSTQEISTKTPNIADS
jgi:trichohyalin